MRRILSLHKVETEEFDFSISILGKNVHPLEKEKNREEMIPEMISIESGDLDLNINVPLDTIKSLIKEAQETPLEQHPDFN